MVPTTDWDLLQGTSHRRLQAVVVEGSWFTARDLAYGWAAGHDDHRWDAACVSVARPQEDPELLVLDSEQAIAWTECLRGLDAISRGRFCAAEVDKKKD